MQKASPPFSSMPAIREPAGSTRSGLGRDAWLVFLRAAAAFFLHEQPVLLCAPGSIGVFVCMHVQWW